MQVKPLGRGRRVAGWGFMRLAWVALFLMSASALAAEPIGEVAFVQGVASAQRPGESPRFLAKGEALHEGDTLSTGAKGFALITLKDGTKLTLRPNTNFTLERFRQGAEDSAIFNLLKGGVRALTGLISKRNPRAVEVKTTTATIGIRGTSFDARLCEADCAEEQGRIGRQARVPQPDLVVARVATMSGSATATGPNGQTRGLNEGTALFGGLGQDCKGLACGPRVSRSIESHGDQRLRVQARRRAIRGTSVGWRQLRGAHRARWRACAERPAREAQS
jgi:hypothetical protein